MLGLVSPYRKGLFAEYYCMFIMRLKGYRIIGHRVQTPLGEIDVIAKRGNMTCIIEVKYRQTGFDEGKFSLFRSYKRVYRAALWMRLTSNIEFKYFIASGLRYQMGDLVY